jgi:hypothetical protein
MIMLFLWEKGDLSLSELRNYLHENKVFTPETSIVNHLKTLQKYEIVKKKEVKRNKPTYELNPEIYKIKPIEKIHSKDIAKLMTNAEQEEKNFKNSSVDDNLEQVLKQARLRNLLELQSRIILQSETNLNKAEFMRVFLGSSILFHFYEILLLEKCKDESMKNKILNSIDKLIEGTTNGNKT